MLTSTVHITEKHNRSKARCVKTCNRAKVAQRNRCVGYYPFGLTFNSFSSGTPNKYLYNQGSGDKQFKTERQQELQFDMTMYRTYDYTLGRFMQVDPKADEAGQERLTPYQYSYNNPVRYNDPNGDCPKCPTGSQQIADDQVLSYLYLNFVAARKNLVSTTVGFLMSNTYSPFIVRTEFSVVADQNGNVSLHQSEPYIQGKLSAALFGTIDGLSLIPGSGPSAALAKNGANPTLGSMTKDGLLKAKKSFEKLIKEHQQKIDDFIKDPIGNTSPEKLKELTKDNPTNEVLKERAMGRVKALESQLNKQKGELKKVNEELRKLDEG